MLQIQIQSNFLGTLITKLLITSFKLYHLSALDYGTPPPELSAKDIERALIKHEIYQDLGYVNYPKHILQVNYEAYHLQLGTKIPDHLATVPPDGINYTHYEDDKYYALLMVGLDVPTREKPDKRAYQHWLIGNIPEDQFLSAEGLVNYEWLAAPYKKGKHRVVFLLDREHDKDELWGNWDDRIDMPRTYFNTTKFSIKYRLGDPVAVNFFITDIEEDHGKGH